MAEITQFKGYTSPAPAIPKPDHPVDPVILTVQDGVPVTETYTLTANGSTLMAETHSGKEPAMITMFTVDGDHLIATHYCIAGNQPQMVTGVPDDLQKGVAFTLARVTGMKTPDDWHNTGVTISLDDANHMTQRWTYVYQGKTGTSVFHYTRKRSGPGQSPPS